MSFEPSRRTLELMIDFGKTICLTTFIVIFAMVFPKFIGESKTDESFPSSQSVKHIEQLETSNQKLLDENKKLKIELEERNIWWSESRDVFGKLWDCQKELAEKDLK